MRDHDPDWEAEAYSIDDQISDEDRVRFDPRSGASFTYRSRFDRYRDPEIEYQHYLDDQAEQDRIDAEEAAHRERMARWRPERSCPSCGRESDGDMCDRCADDPADRDLMGEPVYRDPGWAA